jgi:[acyl-carrier-protein] S-malonyltransferase
MPPVFLFPGQNSRYPAMLEKLLEWDPGNAEWLDRASAVVGRNLRAHFRSSNPDIFRHNADAQIGVFLTSHIHWQILERAGIRASYSAGLSLGEYNHLVHIGALRFEEAIRVLQARGEAYEEAPPGKMAAVLPITEEELGSILENSSFQDVVSIGMLNTPRQCVLSGDAAGVDAVAALAREQYLAEAIEIETRLPMHSPLYKAVGERLSAALARVAWQTPHKPYLPNVDGQFAASPNASVFIDCLARHPWHTVRWKDSVETLWKASPDCAFVEVGPRSVLTNFFGRKWINPRRFATDSEENFGASLMSLAQELTDGSARAQSAR